MLGVTYKTAWFMTHKWVKAGLNDAERAVALLKGISGKRLTYRRINGAA